MIGLIKTRLQNFEIKLLLLLACGHTASFINIQGIQSLMPFIREEFGISRTMAGLYSTFLFAAATGIALFSGNFVDRIGPKRGLLIGIFGVSFLMLFHSLAPLYAVILTLAFLTGISFSIITPSINKGIMLGVPSGQRALSMGIMHSGTGAGGFAGAALLPLLAGTFGWRASLIFSGTLGLALGFLVFFLLNIEDERSTGSNETKINGFKKDLFIIIKNKKLMLTCGLGFVFGLAFGAIPAHYTLYLTMDLQYSEAWAGLALGVVQIGGMIGRIFWCWISDYFIKGNRPNTFLLIIIAIVLLKFVNALAASILSASLVLMLIISFLLGLSALGWPGLYYTAVSERATAKMTGTASGMSLVFLRTGIVVGPPIFGFIGDTFDLYQYSWLVFAISVLIFGIIYFIVR